MIRELKAFGAKALDRMLHAGGWSWMAGRFGQGRTRFDYAKEVGLGLDASVVMAPIQWLQRTLPTAPIAVERKKAEGQRIPNHALVQLFAKPNDFYSGAHLLAATIFSLCVDGNGYWIKVRDNGGKGKPVELWYSPHWMMKPVWPNDGSTFISKYSYTPGGREILLDPEDVVHIRLGVDPANPRLGLSPLRPVLREIWADMEVPTFVAALLRNSGIPGIVISPDGPVAAKPDDVNAIKRYLREQFTGEKRGEPLVLSAKTKTERLGFNPQELDLSSVSSRAEERVCALLGIPAVVVGFGAGNSQTSVGATMHEQVRLAWHNCVIPMQGTIAAELARSLLPDFERQPEQLDVYFDTSEVEALEDEADKLVARAERLTRAGIIKLSEARQMMGMETDDSHNIYLRPFGVVEIPGDTNRAPEGAGDLGLGGDGGAGAPFGAPVDGAVQDLALNGAQIQAVMQIVQSVADKILPAESAIQLLLLSIPGVTESVARALVNPAAAFTPAQPDAVEKHVKGVLRKWRLLGAKHSHTALEERIAGSAPHADPTPEQEAFIAAVDALARKHARIFEKQLNGFFQELGRVAGEAARPILEDVLQTEPSTRALRVPARRMGKSFARAKANEALNLLVTDRVIEAMGLPDRTKLFKEYYERHFLDVAAAIAKASAHVGLGTDLPDRVARAVIATGGRRAGLVDLEGQARDRILRSVAESRAEGAGVQDIARAIEEDVPAGPWSDSRVRSLVIARSETKYAQNVSTLEHARANDVQQFMVFDARLGDSDEICEQLDGAIVSADEAQQLISDEHPNGTRSISPYFG